MDQRVWSKADSGDPRRYRQKAQSPDLVKFRVTQKETDLQVSAERDLTQETLNLVWKYRNQIEKYISRDPEFRDSLRPYPVDPLAPPIVRSMAEAAGKAGVGPMAAVAGAIAEFVGRDLLAMSSQIIVENGGDIFLATKVKRKISLFTEKKFLPSYVDFWVLPEKTPLGICTSSGTEGPSMSFGRADAVMVLSPCTALADAVATAAGNRIQSKEDIPRALDFLKGLAEVTGGAIFVDQDMGFWGDLELVE